MLYDFIVYDPTGKRFTVTRHPDDQSLYETKAKTIEDLTKIKSVDELIFLNILDHNPLPRTSSGLPCYFAVAGKSDNLPN